MRDSALVEVLPPVPMYKVVAGLGPKWEGTGDVSGEAWSHITVTHGHP